MKHSQWPARCSRLAIVGLAAAQLAACATGAMPEQMTLTTASSAPAAQAGKPGFQAVTVSDVSGGSKTNPLWSSQVSSEDFKIALENSLQALGYLSSDGASATYTVSAELTALKQPLVGLDMNVASQVHYVVRDKSGKVVMDEVVAFTGAATVGQAFAAVKRLRLANEASIRGNIESFITRFQATLK